MSLNKKLTLKIVQKDEIRIMHIVPKTWAEFQAALNQMYGNSDFSVTYPDEENDFITIANNLDLNEAFNYYQGKASMKIYLKPKKPISEEFEELKLDDQPEKKSSWKQDTNEQRPPWSHANEFQGGAYGGWRCRGRGRRGFFKGMKKYFKKLNKSQLEKNEIYKIKILQKLFPKKWIVSAGTSVVIGWCVMNKGTQAWPQGTTIECIGRNFEILEPVTLNEVKPGEVANITINAKVPEIPGKQKAVWGFMFNGECIGVLKSKFIVSAGVVDSKVLTMASMGFSLEQAYKALEANNGDLDLAISNILKS